LFAAVAAQSSFDRRILSAAFGNLSSIFCGGIVFL
jgi:hypothetical protein